jgi:hypothetical protein
MFRVNSFFRQDKKRFNFCIFYFSGNKERPVEKMNYKREIKGTLYEVSEGKRDFLGE